MVAPPFAAKHGPQHTHTPLLRRQTHECVCACNMFDLVKNNFSVGILNVGDLALRVRYQRRRRDITSGEASFQTGREQPQRQHQVGDMGPVVAGGRQDLWLSLPRMANFNTSQDRDLKEPTIRRPSCMHYALLAGAYKSTE